MSDSKSQPISQRNHFEMVGLIAISWSHLELAVDNTIWALGKFDPRAAACVTANLGSLHNKLRSLYALMELREADESLLQKVRKFQNSVSGTAEKRNRAVHDPWLDIVFEDGSQFGQFVILANQKGRTFALKPVPIEELQETYEEIRARKKRFQELQKLILPGGLPLIEIPDAPHLSPSPQKAPSEES